MLNKTLVTVVLATAVAGLSAPTFAQAPAARAMAGKQAAVVKPVTSHAPATTTMLPAEQTALVKQYCAGCNNERGKAGGRSLAVTAHAGSHATTAAVHWARADRPRYRA